MRHNFTAPSEIKIVLPVVFNFQSLRGVKISCGCLEVGSCNMSRNFYHKCSLPSVCNTWIISPWRLDNIIKSRYWDPISWCSAYYSYSIDPSYSTSDPEHNHILAFLLACLLYHQLPKSSVDIRWNVFYSQTIYVGVENDMMNLSIAFKQIHSLILCNTTIC